jgi:4-diphosphocytidyl-2-C-methyl-D-erythritol kinase
MPVSVRSFAKINLGLYIGERRPGGYHELRTVYQTVALHDVVRVAVRRGTGIEIRCSHPRVPRDASNTCWRVAERVVQALKARRRVVVEIEKRLPVQGGLGAASSNAVATLLALERALKKRLAPEQRWQIAAEVGSDLPLFLVGGTVLGTGRGEEVFPLPDLPSLPVVVATPDVAVSTPRAFAEWDAAQLTVSRAPARIEVASRALFAWLAGSLSGVPAQRGGDRAETPLLDLVRAGIENDFERVVFHEYPELREVKRVLERAGAKYASLSGSGSAVYGLFDSRRKAQEASARLRSQGIAAQVTRTLPRLQYWAKCFD